jgi:hypothetical protein
MLFSPDELPPPIPQKATSQCHAQTALDLPQPAARPRRESAPLFATALSSDLVMMAFMLNCSPSRHLFGTGGPGLGSRHVLRTFRLPNYD